MIDLEWIRELVKLVDESDIDALEVSRFGTRVEVRKSPPVVGGSAPAASAPPAPSPPAESVTSEPSGATPEATETGEAPEEEVDEDLYEVESPMVGTFYRAPAPDAPPYVEVGDRVQKGETLCILEAMKLMNELEAEVGGEIREICVQNAEPVEYGQVLFRIDTG